MTDSDGAHIFPPRADDQRIIDAIAAQGGPFGLGIDGDFRKALGNFLGLSDTEILAHSVDDMWKHYLDDQGLVNAAEPFSFDLAASGDPDITSYSLTTAAGAFTISGNNHNTPYFNVAGTRAYFNRTSSWETWQYSLSTPGDLSTLSFELTHDWSAPTQLQRAISLPPANDKFYRIRRSGGSGDIFVSADPFANDEVGDVSGGNPYTLTGVSGFLGGIASPVTPTAFVVAPNNLDMYAMSADVGDRAIYHHQMSVLGDADTSTDQGQALDVSTEFDTNLFCIIYSPDGSKLFVVGTHSAAVIVAQYDLSTAYDVNTGVYSGKQITVTPASTVLLGLFVWANPDSTFRLVLTYPLGGASNGSAWRYDQYDTP